jgi:predicted transcriptional regulator of viral defense system
MLLDPALSGVLRPKLRGAEADAVIAGLAARQHDVVGRCQLVALGVSHDSIKYRLAAGRLRRVYRGVYTVCHGDLSSDGRAMAGALLAGADAELSHRSGAHLWGMLRSGPGRIEVTVPRERRRCRALRYHYGAIEPDEVTTLRGIPVTTVSRTIFDLASVEAPVRVKAAMAEAEVLRLTDRLSLADLLERYPHRRGAAVVREILSAAGPPPRTRGELELAFLEFLVAVGLPVPETNVWLQVGEHWIEADCVWRAQKVIAELDSHSIHGTPTAFERDRARDRRLAARRWHPIRVTWRHIHHEQAELAEDLNTLLAA